MELDGCIARSSREGSIFALLVLDLDGFKPINDRHGHGAGDAVLMEVSRRLSASVRKGEIAARLGGDEFVLVLNQNLTGEVAARLATRLIAVLSEPILLPQGEVRVSASVGVAMFPTDGREPDELPRKADVALYRAKNEARGEVRFFQVSMDEDLRQRDAMELDLRLAIANDQIEPYFQPLIDVAHGRVIGFEVLVRWQHPSRGPIPPDGSSPSPKPAGRSTH
jgi:diguanylate cyclase (GGDEF)-like protein